MVRPEEKVLIRQLEVKYIYFILNGSVSVSNKNHWFLSEFSKGSYFGDFQVILGIVNQYHY